MGKQGSKPKSETSTGQLPLLRGSGGCKNNSGHEPKSYPEITLCNSASPRICGFQNQKSSLNHHLPRSQHVLPGHDVYQVYAGAEAFKGYI